MTLWATAQTINPSARRASRVFVVTMAKNLHAILGRFRERFCRLYRIWLYFRISNLLITNGPSKNGSERESESPRILGRFADDEEFSLQRG
jgi:hypothetical protein